MIAVLLLAAALVLRLAYVDATPGYALRHDAVDYDVHARSIAQGEGFSKTLAHGRPTAFRPPGYPYFLGAVYHVSRPIASPPASGCGSRGSRRPSWARRRRAGGRARGAAVGIGRGLVALGLAAIYLPLILVGAR